MLPTAGRGGEVSIDNDNTLPENVHSSDSSSGSAAEDLRSKNKRNFINDDDDDDDDLVIIETPGLIDVEQAERLREEQENVKVQMWWRMILKKIRTIRLRLEETSASLNEDETIDYICSMLPVWKVTCSLDGIVPTNISSELVDSSKKTSSRLKRRPPERSPLSSDEVVNNYSSEEEEKLAERLVSEVIVASVEVCVDEKKNSSDKIADEELLIFTDMNDARPLTLGFPCIFRHSDAGLVDDTNKSRNKPDQKNPLEGIHLGDKFLSVVKCAQCDQVVRTSKRPLNRARVARCGHICCTDCLSELKGRSSSTAKPQCRVCTMAFTVASCHELYL